MDIVDSGPGRFVPSPLVKAAADLKGGLAAWRIWTVLALNDVRQRYRHSRIGQFWNTISMAVTILGVGVVFGYLLEQPFLDYLPFLGIGLIVWTFIASSMNELTSAFIESGAYLRSYPGPRSTIIFRVLLRNLMTSAHNVILIPPLLLFSSIPFGAAMLLVVPGLVLCLVTLLWIGLLLAPVSARFRDVPLIVQSALQLLFFMTPVLFRPAHVQDRLPLVTHYNPLASLMEIVRAPLLGDVPAAHHYIMVLSVVAVGLCLALYAYGRVGARIAYWV
ncbi:MAG TPA: ABC transporter permease [Beijerinckiaceae bacterium]|jgi:lipopolysaccharide transport system permease protein